MSFTKNFSSEIIFMDEEEQVTFDKKRISRFQPFEHGTVIFGGYFGDEGKGKEVDATAEKYKKMGLKIFSARGQGSGNAGHTVVVDGKKYDFHYLTSAGLVADIMLLGPGMLIDPIRILEEAQKLPEEKQKIIMIAERATIVSDLERTMDIWCENQRKKSAQMPIGTTKSGVGPGSGNRGYRFHVTFADAKECKNYMELRDLMLKNPLLSNEVKEILTVEYAQKLWEAIEKLNIVDSEAIIAKCRKERNWAILLELFQAVCLDPLFGNGGHYTTSTPCIDLGGILGVGLTRKDFPDGSTMVLKAYGSKVGGGPYITKFTPEEQAIDDFIDQEVGERGVTTGRKRDLGWFDGPAVRHSIELTGPDRICLNCLDVIANLKKVTDKVKVCFAYKNKYTGEVTYGWPYHLQHWKPLYITMTIADRPAIEIVRDYISLIEIVIGAEITKCGIGPSREDYLEKEDIFSFSSDKIF